MADLPSITHVISPVAAETGSDLVVAQPVTFETMLRAKRYSQGEVDVQLIQVAHESDLEACDPRLEVARPLSRSVRDYLGPGYENARALPILADILNRAEETAVGDVVIYTNVDIALQPYFYQSVASKFAHSPARSGLVINRRTIDDPPDSPLNDLTDLYERAGRSHPGYDCFVFPRHSITDLWTGEVCIGAPGVGLAMLAAMVAVLDEVRLLDDRHLTFHLGDDRVWKRPERSVYTDHNLSEARKVLRRALGRRPDMVTALPAQAQGAAQRLLGKAVPRQSLGVRLQRRLARNLHSVANRLDPTG